MPYQTQKQKTPKDLEKELEKKMQQITIKHGEGDAVVKAQKLNLPFSDLKGQVIDPGALSILQETASRAANIAIIYQNGSSIIVAVIDPEAPETKTALEDLKKRGFSYELMLVSPTTLQNTLDRYKTIKTSKTFELGAIDIKEEDLDKLQDQVTSITDLQRKITQVSVT